MRRFHLTFAIIVVTFFGTAFLVERSRTGEGPRGDFAAPPEAPMDPLQAVRGSETLSGTVRDHLGQPAAGVTVNLRALEVDQEVVEPLFFDHTDEGGRFSIDQLPRGTFELVLMLVDVPHRTETVTVPGGPLDLELNEPWPELRSAPPMTRTGLRGFLAPPPGLGTPSLEGYEVRLLPRDEEARWAGAIERREAVDAEGRFDFQDLVRAPYTLHVLPPWARGGSWPLLAQQELEPDDLGRGGPESAGETRLHRVELAQGELFGRLEDAEGVPLEGALLRVHPQGRPDRLWPATSTDEEGGFVIRDLAPGVVYEVEVSAGGARRRVQATVDAGERGEVLFGPVDPRPGEGDDPPR